MSKRTDLKPLHEEADINLIKQCITSVKDEVNCAICYGTDVFVLLIVYVFWQGCKSKVLMEAFDTNRSLTDTNKTDKKNAETLP